jgi:hypothetical protein
MCSLLRGSCSPRHRLLVASTPRSRRPRLVCSRAELRVARTLRLAAILLLAGTASGVLTGCVGFSQPVPGAPGDAVDLSVFVGTWSQVTEAAGPHLSVAPAEPNGLRVETNMAGVDQESVVIDVRLTPVGDRTIASFLVPEVYGLDREAWVVVDVQPSDDGASLTIRSPRREAVEAAIEAGTLEGTAVDSPEGDWGLPMFEVDGEDLRAFLTAHPEALDAGTGDEDTMVLHRVDPDAAPRDRSDAVPTDAAPADAEGTGGSTRHVPVAVTSSDPSMGNGAAAGWATPDPYGVPASGYPLPMPTPAIGVAPVYPGTAPGGFAPTPPGGPAGTGAATEGPGMPPHIRRLLIALLVVLAVGAIAVFAVARVQRPSEEAGTVADAGEIDARVDAGWVVPGAAGATGAVQSALRQYGWPALLAFAAIVGPVAYLAVLLYGLAFPDSGLAQASGAGALLTGFAPYVLVFSVGAGLGAAEVIATFPRAAMDALGTRWAVGLVLINGLASVLVLSVAYSGLRETGHPVAWSLAVAVGFTVLIRTRFVLARDLRGHETGAGAALDVGWPYGRLQHVCREGIDADLLRRPDYAARRLAEACPDTDALIRIAERAIAAGDPGEVDRWRARLDGILAEDAAPPIARARLARLAVATSSCDEIRLLIENADRVPAAAD